MLSLRLSHQNGTQVKKIIYDTETRSLTKLWNDIVDKVRKADRDRNDLFKSPVVDFRESEKAGV